MYKLFYQREWVFNKIKTKCMYLYLFNVNVYILLWFEFGIYENVMF